MTREEADLHATAETTFLVVGLLLLLTAAASRHEPRRLPSWCNYECAPGRGMIVKDGEPHCECYPIQRPRP